MKLHLPPEQRSRMKSLLRRAGSREIGGVLMGEMIEPGRFRVVDFSVDETSGTRAHFVRTPDHHREALSAFFERTGADYSRFNYLGEWHSHPCFPAIPSLEDLRSMQDLVHGEDGISFAVLLIVRLKLKLLLECSSLGFLRSDPKPFHVDLIPSEGPSLRKDQTPIKSATK